MLLQISAAGGSAAAAVLASMPTAAYHILRDSVPYNDLGPGHFTRRDTKHAVRRLQRGLEDRFSDPALAVDGVVSKEPELPSVIERLAQLEAAVLQFAAVVPVVRRRRRRRG
jgi:uncharacterized protein (DUF1501 family)